jgi:O-antigen ligase
VFYFIKKDNVLRHIKHKLFNIFFVINIIVSISFVFLLQSKAGTLILLLLLFILLVVIINNRKRRYLITLLGVVVLIIGSILLFKYTPISQRLSIAYNQFNQHFDEEKNVNSGSAMQRVSIWRSTWHVACHHFPFGTGTGDIKRSLLQEYEKADMNEGVQRHFNAHNQYLQTFAALGLVGILSLLAWLFVPFIIAAKKKDIAYMLFLLICLLNMLVESMLEARSGVDFMAIMGALLMLHAAPRPIQN